MGSESFSEVLKYQIALFSEYEIWEERLSSKVPMWKLVLLSNTQVLVCVCVWEPDKHTLPTFHSRIFMALSNSLRWFTSFLFRCRNQQGIICSKFWRSKSEVKRDLKLVLFSQWKIEHLIMYHTHRIGWRHRLGNSWQPDCICTCG